MRAAPGEAVSLFNGQDGEWRGRLATLSKSAAVVALERRTRAQGPEPDLWLLAAPIKRDRIDLVAEKAAELGASALWPVFTRRTVIPGSISSGWAPICARPPSSASGSACRS
jgi:16S rRNA (uracil1498-N3)-methyltransferase